MLSRGCGGGPVQGVGVVRRGGPVQGEVVVLCRRR